MLILHEKGAYIRFKHGKNGRQISEDNADVYPYIKSLIGIRILEEQMCFTITQSYLT